MVLSGIHKAFEFCPWGSIQIRFHKGLMSFSSRVLSGFGKVPDRLARVLFVWSGSRKGSTVSGLIKQTLP